MYVWAIVVSFTPGDDFFRGLHWEPYKSKPLYGPSWFWTCQAMECCKITKWRLPFNRRFSNQVCQIFPTIVMCIISHLLYHIALICCSISVYRDLSGLIPKSPVIIRSGGGIHNYLYKLNPSADVSGQTKFQGSNILGKFQITWRTNLGEPGRLQTQQILGAVSSWFLICENMTWICWLFAVRFMFYVWIYFGFLGALTPIHI